MPGDGQDPGLADLQREKLLLEVRELRRWWTRPGALGPFATVIVSLIAFMAAYNTGYLDKLRLESERNLIRQELASLEAELRAKESDRESATRTIAALESQRTRLEGEIRRAEERDAATRAEFDAVGSSLEEAHAANKKWAVHATELGQRVAELQASNAERQRAIDALQNEKSQLERQFKAASDQMALLPPSIRSASLYVVDSGAWIEGRIDGAIFGKERGVVELRVVSHAESRRRSSREEQGGEITLVVLASVKISTASIRSWTPTRVEFELSADERATLARAQGSTPAASRAGELQFAPGVECQVRLQRAEGASSEWTQVSHGWMSAPIPISP